MANERKGVEFLDRAIASKPRVVSPQALLPEVERLWRDGLPAGDSTGWLQLDEFYTVAPGQFTVITGWPSHGKSEWLDALLVNLAKRGWCTALFSPENYPSQVHIAKLLAKASGKPFGAGPATRMTLDEVVEYVDELSQRFGVVTPPEEEPLTIGDVIGAATPFLEAALGSRRGLVIDPWNELEHWRPDRQSMTEYVSQTLSRIRNWARKTEVHVWLVAHPAKQRRENGKALPVPTPDMISDSAHFWSKADCCIAIHRPDPAQDVTEVHVQKVRFQHIGRQGMVEMRRDRVTGRYFGMGPRLVRPYEDL